ncbi:hypothetical protein QJQ45_001638 [Haematococcus lacustris]|nr:hypothetical protein QJQ45_001638 [Haematococcus lacustris]
MSLVAQCLRGSGPVPRSKSRFRSKARENEVRRSRSVVRCNCPLRAGPSVPPAKQREERRAEWKTQRRQVRTPALYAPALLVSPHSPALAHVNDLMEEAAKQRRLLALEEGDSLQDTVPLPCRMRHAVHVCRCLEQWQQPPTTPVPGKPKRGGRRVGPRVLTCPPPFTLTPLARAGVHFVKVDSRVLHGVCQQLGLTRETAKEFTAEPARSNHWDRWFSTCKLANQGFEFERTVETDGVSVCVHYTRPLPPPPAPPSTAGPSSSNSSPAAAPGAAAVAAHELGLPRIGKGLAEQREFVFNPDTQIGVGIDPGVTQAVSAASGVWDPMSGQLRADQLRRWKLTKGEVKHGSGLNNARRDTERWLAPIKPHLQHLAAASSAGTSLEANLKHITVTLATWDAVWEVYLDPKWAEQRLRLYGAQHRTLEQFFKKLEEGMAEVSMERHGHAKQLVVFFGAATIGTGGGWGADAVLRACCKVVCRPRGTDQRRGRVVLVDEHRTSRVSSAVNGKQPCESRLNKRRTTRPAGWKPPPGQVEPRLVRPAWSQQRDQPVRGMMWCPVVPPRKPPQAPRSSQEATQPAASEPGPSTPLPAKRSKRTKAEPEAAEPNKGNAKGKAAKAKPAPQPGRWLDRDCNAALNMQRIGESRWRPLELCYCRDQGALPAKGPFEVVISLRSVHVLFHDQNVTDALNIHRCAVGPGPRPTELYRWLDVEAGPGPGGAFLLWGLAAPLHALTAARMEGAGAGGGTTTGVAAAATATMAGVCAEVAEEGLWRRLLVRVQDCRPYWCVVGPACSDQGPAAGRQPRLLARELEVEATGFMPSPVPPTGSPPHPGWAHSQLQRLQQLLNTR